MKATGIIRRVDDLGRVVIPKEVRRNLGIACGEALEIYTVDSGVVFRKYQHHIKDELANLCELVDDYYEGENKDEVMRFLSTAHAMLIEDKNH